MPSVNKIRDNTLIPKMGTPEAQKVRCCASTSTTGPLLSGAPVVAQHAIVIGRD